MKKSLVAIGVAGAPLTLLWWHSEVKAFLGDKGAEHSARCIYNFGTGDCVNFWLVGLHQTNQIASLFFYVCLVVAFVGLVGSDTSGKIALEPPRRAAARKPVNNHIVSKRLRRRSQKG